MAKEKNQQADHAANERFKEMRNTSLVGLLANAILSIIKLFLGWLAQSQALIADGIHSLSDGLTDAAVIFSAKFSTPAADETHPYGHQRIETVATATLGIVLVLTGFAIIVDASERLLDPSQLFDPSSLALIGALISIVINEGLYQYTHYKGRVIGSPLLLANAWHHRTDALSSVAVFFGVGGVLLGWESLDAVAAIVVALMIIRVGWSQIRESLSELVDSGLSSERVSEIIEVIDQIEGIYHPHRVRTRKMGNQVLMDVHVEVGQRISVSEGHQLAEIVEAKLKELVEEVSDVVVHVDPRDQEDVWLHLPSRKMVLADLQKKWDETMTVEEQGHLEAVTLHYLDDALEAEVVWSISPDLGAAQLRKLTEAIASPAYSLPYLRQIEVHFKLRDT